MIKDAGPRFEAAWGCRLPGTHGLDVLQMMDAARDGKLKALWACGYDVYLSLANETATRDALANLDLVIVQDLFVNETARAFGTVFLPAASFFEKDGTFMNADRRVQRIRSVVPTPGVARSDWWIVQALAARFDHVQGFSFDSPRAIWDEVRTLWPEAAGLTYDRLERESLHWPLPGRGSPRHTDPAPDRLSDRQDGSVGADRLLTHARDYRRNLPLASDNRPHAVCLQCWHDDLPHA